MREVRFGASLAANMRINATVITGSTFEQTFFEE
jgi:hypothetical protein